MTNVRGLLARVRRVEAELDVKPSPIEVWYGSFSAFEANVQVSIAKSKLDPIDMPILLTALRRWHSER